MTMVSNWDFSLGPSAVLGASCCAGPGAPAFSAGAAVLSAAMAEAAAAASNAMDTAIDTGCLRCTFDTGFASGLIRRVFMI
jgi:hypothetical protein